MRQATQSAEPNVMNRTLSGATGENKSIADGEKPTKTQKKPGDPKNPKKAPNYSGKANSKIKVGRSTVTDGNYWKRVIHEDLAKPTEDRKALLVSFKVYIGFRVQLRFWGLQGSGFRVWGS